MAGEGILRLRELVLVVVWVEMVGGLCANRTLDPSASPRWCAAERLTRREERLEVQIGVLEKLRDILDRSSESRRSRAICWFGSMAFGESRTEGLPDECVDSVDT